jgi:hypothetical protein
MTLVCWKSNHIWRSFHPDPRRIQVARWSSVLCGEDFHHDPRGRIPRHYQGGPSTRCCLSPQRTLPCTASMHFVDRCIIDCLADQARASIRHACPTRTTSSSSPLDSSRIPSSHSNAPPRSYPRTRCDSSSRPSRSSSRTSLAWATSTVNTSKSHVETSRWANAYSLAGHLCKRGAPAPLVPPPIQTQPDDSFSSFWEQELVAGKSMTSSPRLDVCSQNIDRVAITTLLHLSDTSLLYSRLVCYTRFRCRTADASQGGRKSRQNLTHPGYPQARLRCRFQQFQHLLPSYPCLLPQLG